MIPQAARRLFSETRTTLRHRLAPGASLLIAAQYTAAALNLTTNVVIARLLEPTGYGLMALAIAYPTLLWSFVGTKSVSITIRYIAGFRVNGRHDELKAVVKLGYGLDLLASFVAFVLVGMTGWWVGRTFYRQPDLVWLMILYAGSFPFSSLTGTSWAVLSSWERFRWLALFEVLNPLIKLCLIISFLLTGFGVAGAVIGTGLGQASVGLVMMAVTTSLLLHEGMGRWWRASLKLVSPLKHELMTLFGWNYLSVTLSGLVAHMPVILLGRLRGPEETGFYRVASSIGTVGSYLETALGRVAYPVLSARWSAGERESLNSSLKRWTLRAGLPAGMFLIFVLILLPILVPLFFGPEYRRMVLGAQVMIAGAAVSAVFFWLHAFSYASGRVSLWARGYAFYTALVIGLSWFVIQRWGFLGLTGLVSAGEVAFTLLMLILILRRKS